MLDDLNHTLAKVIDLYTRGKRKGAARALRRMADAIEREQNDLDRLTREDTTRT